MGFPKQIYDKASQILADRRQKANEQGRLQKEAIYSALPEVAKIDRQLAQTGMATIRAVAAAPNNLDAFIEKMRQENLALQARRQELLKEAGVSEEYFTPPYACPLCQDTGYVENKRCQCLNRLLKQLAYRQLGSTGDDNYRFSNFSLDYYSAAPLPNGVTPRAQMSQVKNYCVEYAKRFSPKTSPSLLFMGGTGLGKTHLSLAIAGQVIEKNYGVVYASAQNLLARLESEHFTSGYRDEDEDSQSYLSMVLQCDLLILDDLGTEFLNQFITSMIYNIINTRLIENRPCIISTNFSLPELTKRYSERLVSRLFGGYTRVDFVGKDIRIQSALMQQ